MVASDQSTLSCPSALSILVIVKEEAPALNEPLEKSNVKSNVNTPESWSPRTNFVGSLGLVSTSSNFVDPKAPDCDVSKLPLFVPPRLG